MTNYQMTLLWLVVGIRLENPNHLWMFPINRIESIFGSYREFYKILDLQIPVEITVVN